MRFVLSDVHSHFPNKRRATIIFPPTLTAHIGLKSGPREMI